MAFIERDDENDQYYELHLTDEESVVLYSVLRHVGGAGKTRRVIEQILVALEQGGFRHSENIKGVIDDGQLKFRD